MAARYLVRFDDICPTMNWEIWSAVEQALLEHSVKPLLAVVPDNRDPKLHCGAARADFWELIRTYEQRGWCIGWHGFQHRYETRHAGVVGIKPQSEFAGLSRDVQQQKLAAAGREFAAHGVRPRVWVAPGHSFDYETVSVLGELGVTIVSDGFFLRPVRDHGALWIPQQLWRFRPMPFGTWTVCCHINSWTSADVARFAQALSRFRSSITSFDAVITQDAAAKNALDSLTQLAFRQALRLKTELRGKRPHPGR